MEERAGESERFHSRGGSSRFLINLILSRYLAGPQISRQESIRLTVMRRIEERIDAGKESARRIQRRRRNSARDGAPFANRKCVWRYTLCHLIHSPSPFGLLGRNAVQFRGRTAPGLSNFVHLSLPSSISLIGREGSRAGLVFRENYILRTDGSPQKKSGNTANVPAGRLKSAAPRDGTVLSTFNYIF
jgi:hypothetical protein